jgi:hypothetical protein
MDREADRAAVDLIELDREAWNLPRSLKRSETSQAPFSAHSAREDKTEPEPEAA